MIELKSETKFYHRLGFIKGLIFSFIFMSIIAYATVVSKPFTFTSGSTISSSEVNQNFDTLYNHLNQAEGSIVELSSNLFSTCNNFTPVLTHIPLDIIIKNDGNFNTSTNEYTIPSTGYYEILFNMKPTVDPTDIYNLTADILLNGAAISPAFDSQKPILLRRKFSASNTIKMQLKCASKNAASVTLSTSGTVLFIKKL